MNILAFFAHPDDETMLAGGTLALLAKAGAHVDYLCATRGEGGEAGEPPLCAVEELGVFREEEMVCAARALGAHSLTFLDYTDPRVGPNDELYPYAENLTYLAGQVAASLKQFSADALVTHGSNGEYGHPAHVLTHQAARLAVESLGEDAPILYTVSASFEGHPRPRLANKDDLADLVLDVTPVLSQKIQAALCHRTQHALFLRRSSQEAGRRLTVPEVVISLEGLHRAYPPADSSGDALFELLKPWSATP